MSYMYCDKEGDSWKFNTYIEPEPTPGSTLCVHGTTNEACLRSEKMYCISCYVDLAPTNPGVFCNDTCSRRFRCACLTGTLMGTSVRVPMFIHPPSDISPPGSAAWSVWQTDCRYYYNKLYATRCREKCIVKPT